MLMHLMLQEEAKASCSTLACAMMWFWGVARGCWGDGCTSHWPAGIVPARVMERLCLVQVADKALWQPL